jgi:hypothetical protein
MNSIGRGWRCCATSLHHYHRALRRLARGAPSAADPWPARAELDTLLFELEVDVRARAGERGRTAMTDVEALLLYPTLIEVHRAVESLSPREDPVEWRPRLQAAMATLRAAVPRLRAWYPARLDA